MNTQRKLDYNQLRPSRKAFYDAFKDDIVPSYAVATIDVIPGWPSERLRVNLLSVAGETPEEHDIDRVRHRLKSVSSVAFTLNVLDTLKKYCKQYGGRTPQRTNESVEHFLYSLPTSNHPMFSQPFAQDVEIIQSSLSERILKERRKSFIEECPDVSASIAEKRGITLDDFVDHGIIPAGHLITRVDFVQPNTYPLQIGQVSVMDESCSGSFYHGHNQRVFQHQRHDILHRARHFIEQHYGRVRTHCLEGHRDGDKWRVSSGLDRIVPELARA